MTGDLNGRQNGSTASVSQTDNLSANANNGIVGYQSDFINFNANNGNYTDKDYSISLTGISPQYSVNANGYTNSFTSNASGNFASNPAPPSEYQPTPASPSEVSMGLGVLLLGVGGFRKRRNRQPSNSLMPLPIPAR